MKCDDFEMLMADALGAELAEADQPAFEGHLAVCAKCRDEYRRGLTTLGAMRSLPAGGGIQAEIRDDVRGRRPRRIHLASRRWAAIRFAAGLFVAFGIGFLTHGRLGAVGSSPGVVPPGQGGEPIATAPLREPTTAATLRTSLAHAYRAGPPRGDLALAMSAMFGRRP